MAPALPIRSGVDIVSVERIARIATERPGFADRVFTPAELDYCRSRRHVHEHMAGRFAAKEAVLKLLGTGLAESAAWTDVEIDRDDAGRPLVRLGGAVAERARSAGISDIDVSLSHTSELAIAYAVALVDAG